MPRNDMGPDDLYRYVASLAKKRQIKFDELARRMQMSKTTLWRYMKGMNAFTAELEKRMCESLEIGDDETDELRQLISINLVDSSLVAARYSIDKFMFGDAPALLRPTELDFAYHYNGRVRSRKSSDIIREIMELTEKPGRSCSAWVVNCQEGAALENVTYLLGSMIPSSNGGKVEQILTLPDKNYRRNIILFLSLLPLLRVNGYSARYTRSQQSEQTSSAKRNMLFIRIDDAPSEQGFKCFYCLTLCTNDVSQCLRFDDETTFNFLKANYDSYSHGYNLTAPQRVNVEPFSQFVCDYESEGDFALIKHDFDYAIVPPEVYQSMFSRMSDSDMNAFAQSAFPGCDDPAKKIKDCMANLRERNKNTYGHNTIYVHSRMGLENFARTGRFRDNHAAMLPFSRRETRRILECIKSRMLDENDRMRLYITYKDFLFCGQVLSACRGSSAFIDVGVTKRLKGMNGNIFLQDEQLADTIYDYADNHIPAYHALDDAGAVNFISSLINKYTD